MSKISHRFNLNADILKECREQMGLTQKDVKAKVPLIAEIESGRKRPTYKQLDTLSELYEVPRWVFISEELPKEYQYTKKLAFRKFKENSVFKNSKVRKLMTRVEQYRDLLIELRQDMDDPVQKFTLPDLSNIENTVETANIARQWLSIQKPLDFTKIREHLERKNIFVFLTSKYKGWSHTDNDFRGLSLVHETMPIIIINDSDTKKAQSFTLMHELGHIFRGETAIDGENNDDSAVEQWCDKFAGEVLMPSSSDIWHSFSDSQLSDIEKLAKKLKVSTYACLVRLRQLHKIDKQIYNDRKIELTRQYEEKRKSLKGGPPRNRYKEVKTQFGALFINTVLNTWHTKEITLHKVEKLLDIKNPHQFLDDSL